jgi:hypothetical protein
MKEFFLDSPFHRTLLKDAYASGVKECSQGLSLRHPWLHV